MSMSGVLVLGGSMLLYLVPQTPGTGEASSTDIVAKVGSETVSTAEVRQQLAEIEQRNQVPKQLESLYARQILNHIRELAATVIALPRIAFRILVCEN